MSSDSSEEDAVIMFYFVKRKQGRKKAKTRASRIYQSANKKIDTLNKEPQVFEDPKSGKVLIKAEDPLAMAGPSRQIDNRDTMKNMEIKMEFEDVETMISFIKTEPEYDIDDAIYCNYKVK